MMNVGPRHISRSEFVGCPVFGDTVRITLTYLPREGREPSLVDFTCDAAATCDIPSWDPCPLYLTYRTRGDGRSAG